MLVGGLVSVDRYPARGEAAGAEGVIAMIVCVDDGLERRIVDLVESRLRRLRGLDALHGVDDDPAAVAGDHDRVGETVADRHVDAVGDPDDALLELPAVGRQIGLDRDLLEDGLLWGRGVTTGEAKHSQGERGRTERGSGGHQGELILHSRLVLLGLDAAPRILQTVPDGGIPQDGALRYPQRRTGAERSSVERGRAQAPRDGAPRRSPGARRLRAPTFPRPQLRGGPRAAVRARIAAQHRSCLRRRLPRAAGGGRGHRAAAASAHRATTSGAARPLPGGADAGTRRDGHRLSRRAGGAGAAPGSAQGPQHGP